MKTIQFLLFISILIFSKKINGQNTPLLIEKRSEIYNPDLDSYWVDKIEDFEYNDQGKITSERIRLFLLDGIKTWDQGTFYEYDNENRLIKKLLRRYNSDVDLWITISWEEYFYDKENCVDQLIQINNVSPIRLDTFLHILGENCQIIESWNTATFNSYLAYEYPDDNNSIIINEIGVSNGQWLQIASEKEIYNEENDLTLRLFYNSGPSIFTQLYYLEEWEYDYEKNSYTNQVAKRNQKFYSNFGDETIPPQFVTETITNYAYSCDGFLIRENFKIVSSSGNKDGRVLYIYDGKDECFKFNQNLEVGIFPNPTSGNVEITSNIFESGDTNLSILSMDGRMVFEQQISSRFAQQSVDLNFLENGIYAIHLRSGKHSVSEKLVVAK